MGVRFRRRTGGAHAADGRCRRASSPAVERGDVYALDAKTGCTHWTYRAQAAVRTAMTVAPYRAPGSVDEISPSTLAMAAPTPMPSMPRAARCCGSASSMSIRTRPSPALRPYTRGASTWRRPPLVRKCAADAPTTVAARFEEVSRRSTQRPARSCGSRTASRTEPKPRAMNKDGVQLFGPAGGGIWGAPTIDRAAARACMSAPATGSPSPRSRRRTRSWLSTSTQDASAGCGRPCRTMSGSGSAQPRIPPIRTARRSRDRTSTSAPRR